MKKGICYSDLLLLTKDIVENVEQLIAHGADQVELLLDGDKWDEMELLFDELAEKLLQLPVQFSVHPPAWDTNLTSENKAIRQASFEEYKKAIIFAARIGAEHVVIHPGFCFSPVFDKKLAQNRAFESIKQLAEVAKPLNVKLVIENVGYNGSSLYTQDEFIKCLNGLDEIVGYLIDTGHAHLNGWNIPKLIQDTKDRLYAIHLHDNNGTGDDHLPIGEGTIAWEKIFDTLNDLSPNCQLILEYAPSTPLKKIQLGKEVLLDQLNL